MKLINPIIIGFGIKNRADYLQACTLADGAIMGSAFINIIAESKDLTNDILCFIRQIKNI